jgi:hypothetical protein
MVSAGLGSTEAAAGLNTQWENQVGTPARLQYESQRTSQWMTAMGEKAKLITDQTDQYPDYASLAAYAAQVGSSPSTTQLVTQGLSGILDKYDFSTPAAKVADSTQAATTAEATANWNAENSNSIL